jgi:hypothetical protein
LPVDDFSDNAAWRLTAYKELVSLVNALFADFLVDYCCNCRSVIGRLPEAENESFTLLEGIYPGCCHRGAGDIFRLEGQEPGRLHLAPAIISGLQDERELRLHSFAAGVCGGTYRLRYRRDNSEITGAHCRYFSASGCILGVLKGPLCINFICPPLRRDLICVCGGSEGLVGPETDFMRIYRSLAVISYEARDKIDRELESLHRRVEELKDCCRRFLAKHKIDSIYDYFNGDK